MEDKDDMGYKKVGRRTGKCHAVLMRAHRYRFRRTIVTCSISEDDTIFFALDGYTFVHKTCRLNAPGVERLRKNSSD